jgi:hypothetical protein
MARIIFSIQGDNVIKTTYMEADQNGTVWGKDDIVLDKETFIQCYEKWIKGQEAEAEK